MLHIDTNDHLHLATRDFVGKSIAVLGITNSGKTNTAAVIIEELLAQGLPMTIVDIEGEYWGLKERFEILVAGRSEHAELAISPDNAAELAEVSLKRGISVILDLSEYAEEEQYELLVAYFTRLWEVAGSVRTPYQVVLEEAHEFIPQGVRTPLKTLLTRIALRGRKRGLGIILMSQRSAKVEKDVLTQAAVLFLQKVVHPIDIKVYKDLIPLAGIAVESILNDLQQGQAVVVANNMAETVSIRLRHTFHAGATPEFGVATEPELRKIDAAMLQELQQALKTEKTTTSNVEAKQARRIQELETLLSERDAEIARLRDENALLSKLTVSMEQASVSSLPTALEISKATVQHMHVADTDRKAVQVVDAAPAVTSKSVPSLQKKLAPVKPAVTPVIVPVNESKIRYLQNVLGRMSPTQHDVFKVLVEQDRLMALDEIAAWLNLSKSWVSRNTPPHALFKIGLVKREIAGNAYLFQSTLKAYLAKEFPGHDVESLARRVFQG